MNQDFQADLVNGENDWLNIQPVIRKAFKFLNDVILKQQEQIQHLSTELHRLSDIQKKNSNNVSVICTLYNYFSK
jgi:hypothetical protein